MWCSIEVVFGLMDDFQKFLYGDFGDMTPGDNKCYCTGNHKLLDDVYTWIEEHSKGEITTIETMDGMVTTTLYSEGVERFQEIEEEEREDIL